MMVVLAVCVTGLEVSSVAQSSSENGIAELGRFRWIAYAPTNYAPEDRPPKLPSRENIRADLVVLRHAGCDGLVTYGSTLPEIIEIAESVGFKAVLLGVWDPSSEDEVRLAKRSALHKAVVGIIVGNEGLMFKRYTLTTLRTAMESLRTSTGKPVSTTEVIESYYSKPELVEWSDFLTVNAHPYFHGRRDPDAAVEWTVAAWRRLRENVPPEKLILFKEVGLPTAGRAGLSETAQSEYYQRLRKTEVRFAFFEAFDAMFKKGPIEQSWGLFHADRTPKPAASVLTEVTDRR